jgi:hypothetical protein
VAVRARPQRRGLDHYSRGGPTLIVGVRQAAFPYSPKA